MKTKNLFFTVVLLIMAGLIFQSCNKAPSPDNGSPLDNLKIPDGFKFESTHVEDITINMPSTVNFSKDKSRFNLYTNDPAKGGKLITAGSFDTKGHWTGEVRVPTALDSIFVQTIAGSQKVGLTAQNVKGSGVIINFGEDYGTTPPDTIPTATKSSYFSNLASGKYKSMRVNNLVQNGNFESNDFGNIPGWGNYHPIDGKWYFTNYYNMKMDWYNDGGNHVIRTPINNTTTYYGGASQMVAAQPGDLITFSADVKSVGIKTKLHSWLYLIPKNANNQSLAYYWVQYQYPSHNWTTKTIAATMPAGTVSVQVLFWTWDYSGGSSSIYFDNAVVTGPIKDTDGDGVDDDMDDYPNDPTRAFNVYYPNQTDWGTLAFEDLWPGKGDYDFNDLILDYHFKSVLNASNQLVEFFTDYSVRAVGASLKNGFGFMLGGNPSNVASVTGTHYTENYIHTNANGTEQGQSKTVIVLFDNAFRMIGSSGSAFINTKTDVPYVDPDTNQLHVLYQTPVSVNTTGTAPYNPFIIVNGERGKEVHLAGQQPTDLVNTSYFGTYADATDPATGKYYQTENNLPWGLDLPVSFAYPVEQVDILSAYNHFGQWAESGGNDYPDWYMDKPGYRVSTNIYTPPTN